MIRGGAVAAAAAATLLAAACARPAPRTPVPPARDHVALAPDPESGEVGALTVRNAAGEVELTERHAITRVVGGAAPAPARVSSDAEIQQLFGPALAVVPPPAVRFLLYFELGADVLTAESKAQVPAVLATVSGRAAPEVSVIGHTDTTGTPTTNAALGLSRAALIRDQLLQAGLDASLVDIASHGESDLLVPTADGVAEPRNRRVEVIVR